MARTGYFSEEVPKGAYRTRVRCKKYNHATYVKPTDDPADFNCGKKDDKDIRCGWQVY